MSTLFQGLFLHIDENAYIYAIYIKQCSILLYYDSISLGLLSKVFRQFMQQNYTTLIRREYFQ